MNRNNKLSTERKITRVKTFTLEFKLCSQQQQQLFKRSVMALVPYILMFLFTYMQMIAGNDGKVHIICMDGG